MVGFSCVGILLPLAFATEVFAAGKDVLRPHGHGYHSDVVNQAKLPAAEVHGKTQKHATVKAVGFEQIRKSTPIVAKPPLSLETTRIEKELDEFSDDADLDDDSTGELPKEPKQAKKTPKAAVRAPRDAPRDDADSLSASTKETNGDLADDSLEPSPSSGAKVITAPAVAKSFVGDTSSSDAPSSSSDPTLSGLEEKLAALRRNQVNVEQLEKATAASRSLLRTGREMKQSATSRKARKVFERQVQSSERVQKESDSLLQSGIEAAVEDARAAQNEASAVKSLAESLAKEANAELKMLAKGGHKQEEVSLSQVAPATKPATKPKLVLLAREGTAPSAGPSTLKDASSSTTGDDDEDDDDDSISNLH